MLKLTVSLLAVAMLLIGVGFLSQTNSTVRPIEVEPASQTSSDFLPPRLFPGDSISNYPEPSWTVPEGFYVQIEAWPTAPAPEPACVEDEDGDLTAVPCYYDRVLKIAPGQETLYRWHMKACATDCSQERTIK